MRILPLLLAVGLCCTGCKKKETNVSAGKETAVSSDNDKMMNPEERKIVLQNIAKAKVGDVVPGYPDIPMIGAVMNSDIDEVRRLAARGIGLNERAPEDLVTPMIAAAQTDQWPVVEILIDHGADIWAHDEFGITAAQRTITSRILRGSPEDQARLRVIEKLKARGYPFPPPNSDEILELDKAGKWPPPGIKR